MTLREQIANALLEKFKETISKHANMPFEETKVSAPNKEIWLAYADAAIEEFKKFLNDAGIKAIWIREKFEI